MIRASMRLKLTLEYDGTAFRGWAVQPGLRTVEGEIQAALTQVYPGWRGLAVAGRTDTGVHALGQVASVDVDGGPPTERAAEALNAALAKDVAVVASEEAEPDFHARHSARSRSYRYRIFRRRIQSPLEARRSWWYPKPIDEAALADSAELLLGKHDFRAFTPTTTQHAVLRRTVLEARWLERGDVLEFEITADSFLRRVVRTMVGTMLELPAERIGELLEGQDRTNAGTTAPAWGLYLEQVQY
jgi:tRNA pseudouridine38-40 synthase